MYDRLNDSNHSNDGSDIEHVEGKPQRKMVKNAQSLQTKKTEIPTS